MATNERVTNKSADDETGNILETPILCTDPISTYNIFSTYDSISMWYNVDNTKAAG